MDVSWAVFVKDFLCLSSIFIGFTVVFGKETERPVRYEDIPFPKEIKILNKTITCGPKPWGKFTAPTYTCDDIRVNGLRLAYGYYPNWGVDEKCQETMGVQELGQLCSLLFRSLDSHRPKDLYAVFVNNATCNYTTEKRLMLVKRSKKRHKWRTMLAGNGWLSSLSCMISN